MEVVGKPAKPSWDDVWKYAVPQVRKFIGQKCPDLPREQKDEIIQSAAVRMWQAYENLDPEKGWKSFVHHHAFGTVMDYLKSGEGFEEESWSLQKEEEHEAVHVGKIRHRVQNTNADEDSVDVEMILGSFGKFIGPDEAIKINWDLLARMASVDRPLRAFLMHVRGHNLEDIADTRGQSRGRIGQLCDEFVKRFDDPHRAANPWDAQVLWALGLAKHFGLKDCDQSEVFNLPLGQTLIPVDLDDETPFPVQEQVALIAMPETSKSERKTVIRRPAAAAIQEVPAADDRQISLFAEAQ